MKLDEFINETDPNTYRSDTKPSRDRYVGYEYDSDGNMVYHGGPEKSYAKYNMDPDWVAANPVKARQIAQAFGKSNPQAGVTRATIRQNKGLPPSQEFDPDNPQGDINRAKFGAMTTGDNKSELQKLRDLGYKWSDGSEISPSTERNYGPGSAADTQFVSRVAAGLPTDNTGKTGVGPKQPFTKADQERHADLRFAQRQSTDTGYEYDPQKRFDQKYDRYPILGPVYKNSPMGKSLSKIKGMFDNVRDKREAIKEDGRIVPGVNTTVDVKPGETERQARKFFGGNGKPKPLSGSDAHKLQNMGLVNENEIVDKHATTPDQNLFDLTGDISNWDGWIKHPKYGILGFSTKDGDDGTQVQRWLNSLGYDVEQDGIIGPQTRSALNDAIGKIRSGEISLQPSTKPEPKAPATAPAPSYTPPITATPKDKTTPTIVRRSDPKAGYRYYNPGN